MKRLLACLLAVIGLCRPLIAEEEGTISGQMFVATTGGENLKLGDVEVQVFDLRIIGQHIKAVDERFTPLAETIEKETERIRPLLEQMHALVEQAHQAYVDSRFSKAYETQYNEVQAAAGKAEDYSTTLFRASVFLASGYHYSQSLPSCIAKTRTDADGRYSFTLPNRGEYALMASAHRFIGDSYERYYWIVGVSLNGARAITLNLANENMTSGTSSTSLVHTVRATAEIQAAQGEQDALSVVESIKADTEKRVREATEQRARYIHDHFADLVKSSQARALSKHPDLAVAGSEFNKRFVARYAEMQAKKDPILDDPFWPERLAGDQPPEIAVPTPPPQGSVPIQKPTEKAGWRTPNPPYPAQAKVAHVQGATTVRVTTDASGNVSSVVITKSTGISLLDNNTQGFIRNNWKGPPDATKEQTFEYHLQ